MNIGLDSGLLKGIVGPKKVSPLPVCYQWTRGGREKTQIQISLQPYELRRLIISQNKGYQKLPCLLA